MSKRKSTYPLSSPIFSNEMNPHSIQVSDYPHITQIVFFVTTLHSPKSTFSPPYTEKIVTWSDKYLEEVVDDMMANGQEGQEQEKEEE